MKPLHIIKKFAGQSDAGRAMPAGSSETAACDDNRSIVLTDLADDLTLLDSEVIDLAGKELSAEPPGQPRETLVFIDYNDDLTLLDSEIIDLAGKELSAEPSPPRETLVFIEHPGTPVRDQDSSTQRRIEISSDFADELSLPYSEITDLAEKESRIPEQSDVREGSPYADIPAAELTLNDAEMTDLVEKTEDTPESVSSPGRGNSRISFDDIPDDLTIADAEITDLILAGDVKNMPSSAPCPLSPDELTFTDEELFDLKVKNLTEYAYPKPGGSEPNRSFPDDESIIDLAEPAGEAFDGGQEIIELTDDDALVPADGEKPENDAEPEPDLISPSGNEEIVELTDDDAFITDDDEDTVNDFDGKENTLSKSQDQIVELPDSICEISNKNEEDTLPEDAGKQAEEEVFFLGFYDNEAGAGAKKSTGSEDSAGLISDGMTCFKLGSDIAIDSPDDYEDTYIDAFRETQASNIEELLDNMIFTDESDFFHPLEFRNDEDGCAGSDVCFYDEKDTPALGEDLFKEKSSPVSKTAVNPQQEQDLLDLLKMDLDSTPDIELKQEERDEETEAEAQNFTPPCPDPSPRIPHPASGIDAVLERTADKMLEYIERIVMDERIISEAVVRAVRSKKLRSEK